ncbi:MAG TPA: ABC transporter permease [Terriglobales bacterium]|nr:ABC transporter permease [Terriglobales bacterium]
MNALRQMFVRFANLVLRRRNDERLRSEIEEHIFLQTEENIRCGMSRVEARRQALLKFGAVEAITETYRDQQSIAFVESLLQDVRYSFRFLKKNVWFTAAAVVTLALGIGANTAIFSAIYAILLAPLEYPNSDRLVVIFAKDPTNQELPLSLPEVDAIAARSTAMEGIGTFENQVFWLEGSGSVRAGRVSGNFFSILGIKPEAGRWILSTDAQQGRDHVVVLNHQAWEKLFGGDPDIVGKSIVLRNGGDALEYEVIGIMPAKFASSSGYLGPSLYFPMVPTASEKLAFGWRGKFAIARLKPGVTLNETRTELQVIASALSQEYPKTYRNATLYPKLLQDDLVDRGRKPLLVLAGAVTFLLLIACLNVSNLVLYRGWSRRREVALRLALGASRWRVVRQLVVETVLLSLIGGALGVLLARSGVETLRVIAPSGTPRIEQLHFHPIMLWYALGVSLFFGIFFGTVAAWQVSGVNIESGLKQSGTISPSALESRRPHRLRSALIVAEIACAMVLLAGSALLIRSFIKLTNVDIGFHADHLLTINVSTQPGRCGKDRPCLPFFDEVLQRALAVPGVKNAALMPSFPLETGSKMMFWLWAVEGRGKNDGTWKSIQYTEISPGYFDTLEIPVVHGRAFTAADHAGMPAVAIVNKSFARQYFGGAAVGKHLALGADKQSKPEWIEIVGQVGDARDIIPWEAPDAAFYLPLAQTKHSLISTGLFVRTALEPKLVAAAIREQVASVDKTAIVSEPQTLRDQLWRDMAEPRFRTALMSSFGLLGLLLAAVGIYGVIAYAVTQRTHELGVRMALGARASDIALMVLREGLLLALVGVLIGLGAAMVLSRYMQTLLFEIKPLDPLTFGLCTLILIGIALLASFVPARRASRLDPMVVLRYE